MSLIVNGVTVDKVIVNGTEIQELSVNGTVVYKVNSSVPIATVYSVVDTDEAYSQMGNADNVVDFGLLDYNINNMPYVSNEIFANKGYKTFIWNMDSINMFYNTNKQTWIESGNSGDAIYNAVSNYKIPIGFFQFPDSSTFITTYDAVKTQSDDGSLDLSSYSYVCHGPMLNYILGQDNLLFGVHYEIKDEIFKSISDWNSTSAHIIGVEYIPSDLDTTILSDIVENIAGCSDQMASTGDNIIVWFIQSNNSLQQWDNLYQILQNAFSSTNLNTDVICPMPPQLLQNQSDWEEYYNQLMDGQLGRDFKVMIVPFTTTSYAKAQGWTWSTAASKFAQQTVGSLTSYDNAYNGQSFAHGIVVLDDINSQIKSKLYDIVYNGLGESSDVPYGIFLADNLYQLYTFPNSFLRPCGIAIDRFNMRDDGWFTNNLDLTVGKYDYIILSYGLQYLITRVNDLMNNDIQPFTQLLISKEKEKCNATNLSDTEFLQKILELSQKIQETNIQVIAIDSDGNGGQLVGGA